ncbi:hybrid sensor histidine kinase/response regulator [Chitinophaga silvisoli]|nr:hybrid sensor histidine kinase/response regulator [Chitinophaga silvisoli]
MIKEQAIALQQADAKIDHLLKLIHDLRSPLSAILNALPLLERSQNIISWLKGIRSSCTYLISLISNITTAAKIDAGQTDILHYEPLLLRCWIENALDMMTSSAKAKEVTLELEIDQQLPDYINTDRIAITRILTNLLDNAISFSPIRRTVKVSCQKEEQSLSLRIVNEGLTDLPRDLFEPYVSQKEGGTGLGLAIVRNLVQKMNGEVSAYKTAGGDCTTFLVNLPLESNETLIQCEPATEEPVTRHMGNNGLNILIFEDDLFLRSVITEHLLQHPAIKKVTTTGSGQQGLRHATLTPPDVIIIDDKLIDMDGLTVVKQFQLNNRLANIPIIIASGGLNDQDQIRYLESGIQEYLQKPYNMDILINTIQRITSII